MSESDKSPCAHLSREYKHLKCGSVSKVSGDDLVLLECAFRPCVGTVCAACKEVAPLNEFEWLDSGENIEKYRDEIYNSTPFWSRLYYNLLGNAYEGALRLRLDKYGKPLPPDQHRRA